MMRTCAILRLLGLLLLGSAMAAAEPPGFLAKAEISDGVQTISFSSPAGVIRIYLPDDIRPGDRITGTIGLAPQGTTPEARVANESILRSHAVELGDQRRPVHSPTVAWTLPAALPPGGITLGLRNDKGKEVARTTLPVMTKVESAEPAFHLPEIGQTGRLLKVTGPFDGNSDNTKVNLDADALELIAESPRHLIVRNSYNRKGVTRLGLRERDRTVEMDFRSVAVNLAAPKTALLKGETTTLTVKVTGLEGLPKEILLVLENTSSTVIRLSGGDAERLRIIPSSVVEGGVTIERTVTGIKNGSWTINCTLVKDE